MDTKRFLDAKGYTENSKAKLRGYYDKKNLDHFSVIVAEEEAKFWILDDTINEVSVSYQNNKPVAKPYEFNAVCLKNDTLFISEIKPEFTLFVKGKSVKKIIGKENSEIGLSSFYNDTVSLDLIKSKISGSLRYDSIKLLKVIAKKHSNINLMKLTKTVIDSLTKKPTQKTLNLIFKEAEITLKDHSELSIQKPQKLLIEADSTSTYSIHKSNSNEKVKIISITIPD
jgi:hypothetical protein